LWSTIYLLIFVYILHKWMHRLDFTWKPTCLMRSWALASILHTWVVSSTLWNTAQLTKTKYDILLLKLHSLTVHIEIVQGMFEIIREKFFMTETNLLWNCNRLSLQLHLRMNFVNNQLDAQFIFSYMFISILYTFRAAMCPSSGELIVSIRYLVYVTLKTSE